MYLVPKHSLENVFSLSVDFNMTLRSHSRPEVFARTSQAMDWIAETLYSYKYEGWTDLATNVTLVDQGPFVWQNSSDNDPSGAPPVNTLTLVTFSSALLILRVW